MKKYETPEYEIEKFTIESIMTDSGLNGDGNNQISCFFNQKSNPSPPSIWFN